MTKITSEPFGNTKSGKAITKFTLENDNGMRVCIISFACAVQSVFVPDRNGKLKDVVLGYDTVSGYENDKAYFGMFVGRYANRIKNAEFTLSGKTYKLEKNDGNNHLHGAYCHEVFDGYINGGTLVFRHLSKAFDEGYPGNLEIELRYTLTDDNAFQIEYKAKTDEDTVVNFTNHSFFNLNGQDGSDILSHELLLNADRFIEIDKDYTATGNILSVENTPLDFRIMKPIGRDIKANHGQIKLTKGYDQCVIFTENTNGLKHFGTAKSENTGIMMTCYTTEPAAQLYTGNYLGGNDSVCGKNNICYPQYGGFCLEAQHYPNSVNIEHFPSTVLKADEEYYQKTIYKFSVF